MFSDELWDLTDYDNLGDPSVSNFKFDHIGSMFKKFATKISAEFRANLELGFVALCLTFAGFFLFWYTVGVVKAFISNGLRNLVLTLKVITIPIQLVIDFNSWLIDRFNITDKKRPHQESNKTNAAEDVRAIMQKSLIEDPTKG